MSTAVRAQVCKEAKLLRDICRFDLDKARAFQDAIGSFEFAKALSQDDFIQTMYAASPTINVAKISFAIKMLEFSKHETLDGTTTFANVQEYIMTNSITHPAIPPRTINISAQPTLAAPLPNNANVPAGGNSVATATSTSRKTHFDKLTVKDIPLFTGIQDDWIDWKQTTIECLRQTVYGIYIDNKQHQDFNPDKNKQFYNLLVGATKDSTSSFLVRAKKNDGQAA